MSELKYNKICPKCKENLKISFLDVKLNGEIITLRAYWCEPCRWLWDQNELILLKKIQDLEKRMEALDADES